MNDFAFQSEVSAEIRADHERRKAEIRACRGIETTDLHEHTDLSTAPRFQELTRLLLESDHELAVNGYSSGHPLRVAIAQALKTAK